MSKKICWCFGHTEAAIEEDLLSHGRSTILEEIAAAKRSGGCRCAEKNPKKR